MQHQSIQYLIVVQSVLDRWVAPKSTSFINFVIEMMNLEYDKHTQEHNENTLLKKAPKSFNSL